MLTGGRKAQRRKEPIHLANLAPADERDRSPGGRAKLSQRLLESAVHRYARRGGSEDEQRAVDI
jgi:hypothetical protein